MFNCSPGSHRVCITYWHSNQDQPTIAWPPKPCTTASKVLVLNTVSLDSRGLLLTLGRNVVFIRYELGAYQNHNSHWLGDCRVPGLSRTVSELILVHSQDEPTSFTCSLTHIPGLLFHQPSTPALSHLPFYFQHWLTLSHSAHKVSSFLLVHGSLLLQNIPLSLLVPPRLVIPSLFICMTLCSSPHRNTVLYKANHAETLQMNFSCSFSTMLLLSLLKNLYNGEPGKQRVEKL